MRSPERHYAIQHCVKDHTTRPDVDTETFITPVPENLRCYVGWRAALLRHDLASLDDLADAEVADFDLTARTEQDVVQFDVAVQDSFRVAVIETADDLLEHALRDLLFELAALAHVA